MTGSPVPPLTAAQLSMWAPTDVDAVLAGLDPAADPDAGPLDWTAPTRAPQAPRPTGALADRAATASAPDAPAQQTPPPLRLILRGDVLPAEIVPVLLRAPGVGSAVVPVERPPGALLRRPWSWPLRIGAIEPELLAALSGAFAAEGVPPDLAELRDVRVEPGAVDVLVLRGGLADAAAFAAAKRQVANAVLCASDASGSWPVVDAHLAMIRAASAAVLTGIVAPAAPDLLAQRVARAVRLLSHAQPCDVALTTAFERGILLVGEPYAIAEVTVPDIVRSRAQRARSDLEGLDRIARSEPPPPVSPPMPPPSMAIPVEDSGAVPDMVLRGIDIDAVLPLVDQLDALADAPFDHESGAASAVVETASRIDETVDPAVGEVSRPLQARVGAADAGGVLDGRLHAGRTVVDVFVGPPEHDALHADAVPQHLLFDRPEIQTARLTVVFAPLVPVGEAQHAELDVPRVGRSADVRFAWPAPDKGIVQARIIVLHRNRVLQTAKIGGRVGGPAEMTERIVLWGGTADLDERQPFDRAFVLNHARGKPRSVSVADGRAVIDDLKGLESANQLLRTLLMRATQISGKGKKVDEAVRRILVDTATAGHQLFRELESRLEGFASAHRVQIVSDEEADFLPLELIYDRLPPDADAPICARWAAGEPCGEQCFAGPADTSVLCPSVFWGMSRVVERQRVPERAPEDDERHRPDFVVLANPTGKRSTLEVSSAVVAASERVAAKDVARTVDVVAVPAPITTWADWKAEITARPADVLVLMPHTEPRLQTMEISGATLMKGALTPPYVTGSLEPTDGRNPLAVLFGCDTAGSVEDPAGWVGTFMQSGAAAVFSTMTMLTGQHAAAMAQQLMTLLRAPDRSVMPLGELVARFRREGVRSGLVAALAVTAYGDAGWKV